MMAKAAFNLDLDETFQRLARPPIMEAVIHWQARAQNALDQDSLASTLAAKLPEYRSIAPLHRIEWSAKVSGDGSAPVVEQDKGWLGFRLYSEDDRFAVQFQRDGVVFSQTRDYEEWHQFVAAAKHVWNAFVEIGSPLEIQRLGVRFINHFSDVTVDTLDELLREPPTCPSNLPLKEFVYQSTFTVPDHPYGVRVIKVLQPSMPDLPQSSGLFLDCDVFTTKPVPCEEKLVDEVLVRMRWLKNKVFFSLLTDQAVRLLA